MNRVAKNPGLRSMKKTFPIILCLVLPWAMGACERHSWTETRRLRETHAPDAARKNAQPGGVGEHAPAGRAGVSEGAE